MTSLRPPDQPPAIGCVIYSELRRRTWPAGRSEGRANEEAVTLSVQVRGQLLGVTEGETESLTETVLNRKSDRGKGEKTR